MNFNFSINFLTKFNIYGFQFAIDEAFAIDWDQITRDNLQYFQLQILPKCEGQQYQQKSIEDDDDVKFVGCELNSKMKGRANSGDWRFQIIFILVQFETFFT